MEAFKEACKKEETCEELQRRVMMLYAFFKQLEAEGKKDFFITYQGVLIGIDEIQSLTKKFLKNDMDSFNRLADEIIKVAKQDYIFTWD